MSTFESLVAPVSSVQFNPDDLSVYAQGYPVDAHARLNSAIIAAAGIQFDYTLGRPSGRWDDRSTWRLDGPSYGQIATEEQWQIAQAVLDAFDPWGVTIEQPSPAPSGAFDSGPTLEEVRDAYEDSHADDGDAGAVDSDPADIDPSGDIGEPVEAGSDADPSGDPLDGGDYSAEPLAGDTEPVEEHQAEDVSPADFGGVLVTGDALTTAKALLSWQVEELENEKLEKYDAVGITEDLKELRGRSLGHRDYGWPALTDAENEKLQALETFNGHIQAVQAYGRKLRKIIKLAENEAALGLIDINSGWPE